MWHMHQPLYKDAVGGQYNLPWVRLHAVKDYLHMAEVLGQYPKVKATFNFVPSLIEQIEDYASGRAEDAWEAVSRKERLDDDDKRFVLASFFSISWDRFVRRYPRYWRLLQLRNQLDGAIDLLSDTYWRDLTAWFNLAWIEPGTIEREPELRALVEKGERFTRQDVETILSWHHRLSAQVLPAYRDLSERGQIELSTSPYYHPILPLLIDTRSAREASPNMTLPNILFHHPEDAEEQLRRGRANYLATFGREAAGLWPSEGAVSHAVAEMLAAQGGWRWVATDEAILARSIGRGIERDGDGNVTNPDVLYQPYRFGDSSVSFVFRDRVLSDRIGFVYRHFSGRDAARDLVDRLHRVRDLVADDPNPHLVPIILDGENCWEEYPENGREFLHGLYELLSADETLRTVTLDEYVREHPPRERIDRLAAGSWIFGNLETWIGEGEQNRAWEYLAIARAQVVTWERAGDRSALAREQVWRALYTAEGSDWFWWYYSRNKFGQEQMFDQEFRSHLVNIYKYMDLPTPAWLEQPIWSEPPPRFRAPTGYVSPRLSAHPQPPAEWARAGYLDSRRSTGAMQMGSGLLSRVYFGYNPADIHVRIESGDDLINYSVGLYLGVEGAEPHNSWPRYADDRAPTARSGAPLTWEIALPPNTTDRAVIGRARGDEEWEHVGELTEVARKGGVAELCLPLDRFGLQPGQTLALFVVLARDRRIVETLPTVGDDQERLSFSLAVQA
jgi:alpha-amylase/alpha-mannosidase (GH57 family)